MSRQGWTEELARETGQRPVWDLLEVLERGAANYPRYVALYPSESPQNRVGILLAGLALGPEAGAAIREQLSRRDSKEKWAVALGLGEMGHPEVEGYFARVLREKPAEGAVVAALGALGRIRGPKSLPLVVAALDHAPTFEAACAALASYGTREGAAALLPRVSELGALKALAEIGEAEARDQYVAALGKDEAWAAAGARGIGRSGLVEESRRLLPLLESRDPSVAAAAFESYAQLGAPQGVEALLRLLPAAPPAWMVDALTQLAHPAVHRRLLEALSPPGRQGLLGRILFWKKRSEDVDPRAVYRALRQTENPEVLAGLAARVEAETQLAALRELLSIPALTGCPEGRAAAKARWRGRDLSARYLAARALLQSPDEGFLGEALTCLSLPGFRTEQAASPLWDETHALAVYAQDSGACVLVSSLLDSGLLDLDALGKNLVARLAGHTYPPEADPAEFMTGPADRGAALFLRALAEAAPALREPLRRLGNLLAQLDDRGDCLLDLLLCSTGLHIGGIQRAIFQALPSAVGRLLQGKDDRFLPTLDDVAARIPDSGPLRPPLLDLFLRARMTVMAECRDMTIFSEGSPRGDMVLVEQLRTA